MSDQEFFLSDFISVKHGFAFKGDFITTEENENCLLTPGNFMIGGGFKSDKFKYFSGDIPQDYILKEDDLIITMTDLSKQGDTLGYSALVPSIYGKKMLHNQRIGLVEFKNNELDKHYLYFLLRSHEYRSYILGCSTGSTVRHTSPSKIVSFKFVKPDLEIQKKIASKLLSLEKKIELNIQINQTLEQIAQVLFKSWFIDFDPVRAKVQALSGGLSLEQAELAAMQAISGKTPEELTALSQTQPERYAELAETAKAFPCEMVEVDGVEVPKGWTFQYLKDACNIVYGKGLPKTKLTNTGYRVFGANGVIGYYSEFMYKNPQILIGCRGTVGQVTVSTPFSFITNNSLIIEYENSLINRYYLEHYLRTLNLKEISSGSVQPQITIQNMSGVKLLTPNRETLLLYEINVKDIYETMYQNQIENEKLTKVRDLLLPKLLNGEIE